ncbi:MAG: CatB-related O-acetyltransferase [Clostridiales bacterium]|nr:CatB-related O-acetyltransferase [Clostridiales bacterium]
MNIKSKIKKLVRHNNHKDCFIADGVNLNDVKIGHKANFAYGADLAHSSVGSYTSIGRRSTVRNCTVGNFCSISYNVSLGAGSHPMGRITGSAAFYQPRFGLVDKASYSSTSQQTIIGHSVWIGCNAVVMGGINIGNGAVIGAGAVVTHDVKPYEIVAGVPAAHLRWRFSQETIELLEKLKWWEWNDEQLKANRELFSEELSDSICEKLKLLNEESIEE